MRCLECIRVQASLVMNLREEPRMILKFVPEIMPAKKGTQEWISEKDGV